MAFNMNKVARPSQPMSPPITTLIQVTGYKLEGDPKDHRILGVDLENRDENGVPKKVEVAIKPYREEMGKRSGNHSIPKPKDFAEWQNTKTEIGGTILVSRAVEKDGVLVADYAQRVAKDKNWVRQGNNGVDYKIGCQSGYISVRPDIDRDTGKLQVVGGNGKEFHRAKAWFYPDNANETVIGGGPGAGDQLKAAVEQAIDNTPDPRAQPIVMLFQDGEAAHQQIYVKNVIKDPQTNQYRTMTRDEMKQGLEENTKLKDYMAALSDPEAQGTQFRTRNGFGMDLLDSREVNQDATQALQAQGVPMNEPIYNKTRVEKLAPETLQQFRMPKHMQTEQRKRDIQNKSVFVHGYVSYEIPTAENQKISLQKIAKTLDQNFDQSNSVNGGITKVKNPHFEVDDNGMYINPNPQVDQIPNQPPQQQGQPASQQANHQASMAAQAPIQGNQTTQQAAQQQAAHQQPQQPAASSNYGQPEPMPEPPMPSDDEIDQLMDDGIPDFQIDDFDDEMDEMAQSYGGPR